MDLTLILIGILLVFVGAAFFGYPVGLMIGKNGWGESFESSPERVDVLSEEYIEEAKRC